MAPATLVHAPDKFYPLLALYHLLPLHFPITTWGFDVAWGRFAAPSMLNVPGNIAWFCMEIVSPTTFFWTLRNPSFPSLSQPSNILAGCFLVHYAHRAIISPLVLSPPKSPMHLSATTTAIAYNALNGYCMAVFLALCGPQRTSVSFWVGIAGWAIGFIGNVYHDEILNDLRRPADKRLITAPSQEEERDKEAAAAKSNSKSGGKGRYAIPRGGLFSLVSFPNYLCEWFEWTAFAIAGGRFLLPTPALTALPETVHTWLSAAPAWWPAYLLPPPWMFVLFEISCMLPRAINAHRWYHRTFGDRYPRDRKIVIPYLL